MNSVFVLLFIIVVVADVCLGRRGAFGDVETALLLDVSEKPVIRFGMRLVNRASVAIDRRRSDAQCRDITDESQCEKSDWCEWSSHIGGVQVCTTASVVVDTERERSKGLEGHILEASTYDVIRFLGLGSSGQAFLARKRGGDRNVAIKFMVKSMADGGGYAKGTVFPCNVALDKAVKEFSAIKRAKLFPFAQRSIGWFIADGVRNEALHDEKNGCEVYFVSEVAIRGSLRDFALSDAFTRSQARHERTVRIFAQVLLGLMAAHAHGLSHCDIKDGNIFVDADYNAVIGDWESSTGDLSRCLGTRMPPEFWHDNGKRRPDEHKVAEGKKADDGRTEKRPIHSSDSWALGVVIAKYGPGSVTMQKDHDDVLKARIGISQFVSDFVRLQRNGFRVDQFKRMWTTFKRMMLSEVDGDMMNLAVDHDEGDWRRWIDLAEKLLQINPAERWPPARALGHPVFNLIWPSSKSKDTKCDEYPLCASVKRDLTELTQWFFPKTTRQICGTPRSEGATEACWAYTERTRIGHIGGFIQEGGGHGDGACDDCIRPWIVVTETGEGRKLVWLDPANKKLEEARGVSCCARATDLWRRFISWASSRRGEVEHVELDESGDLESGEPKHQKLKVDHHSLVRHDQDIPVAQ